MKVEMPSVHKHSKYNVYFQHVLSGMASQLLLPPAMQINNNGQTHGRVGSHPDSIQVGERDSVPRVNHHGVFWTVWSRWGWSGG